MENKKVLIIPPANVFSRYVRTRGGLLRMAVYTVRLFPFDAAQMRFSEILRLRNNWSLVGVYTDNGSIGNNKNDFRKLMKLCERRKVDMIMCSSKEHLSEKITLLNKIGIPIYIIEESRIIDHEVGLDSLTRRMSG